MQVVAATSGDMSTCEGGQQHGHGRSRSRVHPKELVPEKGDGHRGGRLPMGCHAHAQARLRPSRTPSEVLCRIESIHVELTRNAMFNYSPCGRRGLRLPLQRHLGALCRLPPLEGSLTAVCKQESMHADQPPEEVTKK